MPEAEDARPGPDPAAFERPPFRILGPLEVEGPAGPLRISSGREEAVLALLLLETNQVVAIDRVVDTLWNHDPPETVRTQVQILVSRLRRKLTQGGVQGEIVTRPPGYLLSADPRGLDARVFAQQVALARRQAEQGEAEAATAVLRRALDLWRGPALDGLTVPDLRARAQRLDEERLEASETLLELELGLGHHHRLIGVLGRLVHEQPLRERVRGLLMLALYRSGRQAEALRIYREGRSLLIEELGLGPGQELRALEGAILTDDPALRLEAPRIETVAGEPVAVAPEPRPAAVPVRPRQLPADTADFIADAALVEEAVAAVTGSLAGTPPSARAAAVHVLAVSGAPGVGKSTLAAHVGHRVADRFVDGQLYCDLGGGQPDPAVIVGILGRFLKALGIPGPLVPDSLEGRVAMYRTLLAGRRVLVVVDDATAESQVVPLLPGEGGCAVIVTSRVRLTGIPGVRTVELGPLRTEQALELLEQVAGAERVRREPDAAEALVTKVGALPLAVRIIAARLAARPHWTLASMVQRLVDERHRLDELEHGELTIRASLSLTHDGLDPSAQRLFALLSLCEGPTFPGWVAGPLLDDHRPFPPDLLEPLIDVQMLNVVGMEPGGGFRYQYQDIIRLFARERLSAGPPPESLAALARLAGAWLTMVERAHRAVYGGDFTVPHGDGPRWFPPGSYLDPLIGRPLDWMESELGNLRAVIGSTARAGLDELAWDLAVTATTVFEERGHLDDWEATHEDALRAVRLSGNTRGTAALLASMGTLHVNRGQSAPAEVALTSALDLFHQLDVPTGLGLCHRDLGLLRRRAGDDDGAMRHYDEALRQFGRADDVVGRAITLTQRAHVLARRGRLTDAHTDLDEAMAVQRGLGYVGGMVRTMRRIGQLQAQVGEFGPARKTYTRVLGLVRDSGDVIGEGHLLRDLAEVCARAGQREEARRFLEEALICSDRIMDDRGGAEVRVELAASLVHEGRSGVAAELVRRARDIFRDIGLATQEAAARRQLEAMEGG